MPMEKTILLVWSLLISTFPVSALDVGDISSFMHSNDSMISKEIKNTTTSGRFINIHVDRITSPLDNGETIPMDSKNELLFTPGSLLLPAKSNEIIRFYYNGPEDNRERYYRITWLDQALSEGQRNNSSRNAIATVSARISTILVVAPRKVKYDYQYTPGKILNTGNATLRLIAYGPCLTQRSRECKENYFLMPGKSRVFTHVDVSNPNGHIAFWQAEHFIPIK
ncbi:YagY protein [Enterobacter sp. FY-07]|nr:YagY protein [Enterobacter sp. FY-07]